MILPYKIPQPFVLSLVLIVSTLWPRLVYLAVAPRLDEGFFIWQARFIYESLKLSSRLPDTGTLALYPLLLSPLCALGEPLFLWFRIADGLIAILTAYLFCKILQKLSSSWPIALSLAFIFLCALNLYKVIDAGFKNPIAAAFLPLFGAIMLLCSVNRKKQFFLAGVLTALSVLLREPFCLFALAGFCIIWLKWGFSPALRYAFGGMLCAFIIFLLVALGRHDPPSVILSYKYASAQYADSGERVLPNFINYGLTSLRLFICPLIVTLFFLAYSCRVFFKNKNSQTLSLENSFWLAIAMLPIAETLVKISFPYHFAVCLPWLGFYCASSWESLQKYFSQRVLKGAKYGLIGLLLASALSLPSPARFLSSLNTLSYLLKTGEWPKEMVEKSNFLMAAEELKKILPPNGTLASSAFSYNLYSITGAMSPLRGNFDPDDIYKLSDLARSWRVMGKDSPRLAQELQEIRPDAIAIAFAHEHEKDYKDEMLNIVNGSGLYELSRIIPINSNMQAGWMGFYIFRKK